MKFELRFLPQDVSTREKYRAWKSRLGSNEDDRKRWRNFYLTQLAVKVRKSLGNRTKMIFGPVELTGGIFLSGVACMTGGQLAITITGVESRS